MVYLAGLSGEEGTRGFGLILKINIRFDLRNFLTPRQRRRGLFIYLCSMQKQIAAYLFQNKTCPLPGLGTLAVFKTGAEVDFTNKSVTAPVSSIRFENKETDTAGLLNYLSAATGHSGAAVTASLAHFCDDLKKEMAVHTTAKLDSIGDFYVDGSGKISFQPEALPEVFFQPVFAERVIHPDAEHQILVGDKETTNTVMTELLAPKTAAKDYWWIWAIVLGAAGLLALLIYFTEFNGTTSFGNTLKI